MTKVKVISLTSMEVAAQKYRFGEWTKVIKIITINTVYASCDRHLRIKYLVTSNYGFIITCLLVAARYIQPTRRRRPPPGEKSAKNRNPTKLCPQIVPHFFLNLCHFVLYYDGWCTKTFALGHLSVCFPVLGAAWLTQRIAASAVRHPLRSLHLESACAGHWLWARSPVSCG